MASLPVAEDVVRAPFIEHFYELRRRLLICSVFIAIGAGIGYWLNDWLLAFIQQPLGQKLFYTSPTGGFSFVFMLCVFFGVVFALPCIIYQIIAFLKPVLPRTSRRAMFIYPICSIVLAALGIAFAYNLSLPASLHFLANFGGSNIESLITTDTYFSFALSYIGGFAILFQLPLILIIINRITPLKPGRLMKWQRYVIVASFIGAAMITPTPDPFNQLLMAGPIIILYQLSILSIWLINKTKKKSNAPATPPQATVAVNTKRHPAPLKLAATMPLSMPHTPQREAQAPRRLISDISASHRTFSQSTKQSILHSTRPQPLKVNTARMQQGPPTQWSGGLIDVLR